MRRTINAIAAVAALAISPAHANVTISSDATKNMTCSNGICAPTAKNAVLNAGDLESLLASGAVEVTTTGSGVQADTIKISTALTWSSNNTLALDAHRTVLVEKPVSVAGTGGLSVTTDDGGSGGYFGFGADGNVTFANLSGTLAINGEPYTLEGNIKALAAAIAANSAGNYALANGYDASKDGTYQNSPISTDFSGNFDGLGNTISNLSLNGTGDINSPVGLFAEVSNGNQLGGAIANINLQQLRVDGAGFDVGGLVGNNAGTISGSFVNGSVESEHHGGICMGLLTGVSAGIIARSGVIGSVMSSQQAGAGGLSCSGDVISQSFADVKISAGAMSVIGALEGGSGGPVRQSYAAGRIVYSASSDAGGLVGENSGSITQSYSTTTLRDIGHKNHQAGGLIGVDESQAGSNTSDYWDLSTSHVRGRSKGAGTPRDDPGITGLTTQQLQSGLPAGFDPSVWAEDPKINNGLPYLIDNPPRN